MSSTPAVASAARFGSLLTSIWPRIGAALSKMAAGKRRGLRLCESLSLGEKRVVAIIECDRQRFLIAATPQNISLLQSLGPAKPDDAEEK
ncbi:MAG TPA: flagellar biosynthetic protein FliO [Verrucomicrobiae bacterium]|nr:flagellar biosynthetic protein FliO [Verrucomicrobiae bacterium]